MAESKFTETMPHNSPETSFLMPKITAKFKLGHHQWGRQMQVV